MNFDFPVEIIRRDRTKSASIEVLDGVVNVIVPNSLSEKRIEGLIKSRTVWIRQKLIEQHQRVPVKAKEYVNGETFTYLGRNYRLKLDENTKGGVKLKNGYLVVPNNKEVPQSENDEQIKQALEAWYQRRAHEKLSEKTKRYAAILGVEPTSVDVKNYTARWGSCSANGHVSYNWKIIIAPHAVVDYIVVHELCHLIEHNHGPKYWKQVANVVPNYKEHREWLKVNGEKLIC